MAWYPCCCTTGTPCFCSGSFGNFQITFSGITDGGITGVALASTINATHTIPISVSESWRCYGTKSWSDDTAQITHPDISCPSYVCDNVNTYSMAVQIIAQIRPAPTPSTDLILEVYLYVRGYTEACYGLGTFENYIDDYRFTKTIANSACTSISETLNHVYSLDFTDYSTCTTPNIDVSSVTCEFALVT